MLTRPCPAVNTKQQQVVFEAPPGIKQNIQRTYAFWSSDFLAGHAASSTARRTSSGDDDESNSSVRRSGGVGRTQLAATPANLVPLRAQMLFMLAWFNAVLQERQNYVPIVSVDGGTGGERGARLSLACMFVLAASILCSLIVRTLQ